MTPRRQVIAAFGGFGWWWGSFGASLPDIQRRARLDDGALGLALLLVAVAALPAMRLAGILVDRRPRRAVPVLLAAFAAAGLTPGVGTSFPRLAAATALLGAASGALDVAVNAAGAAEEARGARRLLPPAHAGFSLGVVGGSLVAGGVRSHGGGPALVLGVAAAVLLAVAASWRPEPAPAAEPGAAAADAGSRVRLPRRLLLVGLACGVSFLIEDALQNWSAVHLERTLGASPGVGALAPAAFGLAAAAGRLAVTPVAGRVADEVLVRCGGLLAAGGLALAAAAPSPAPALVGLLAAGAGTSVCAPLLFGVAGRAAGPARGRALARVTTLAYAGFVLGPPFVGGVGQLAGLRVAFGALAGVALVLAALAGVARPLPPRDPFGLPPGNHPTTRTDHGKTTVRPRPSPRAEPRGRGR